MTSKPAPHQTQALQAAKHDHAQEILKQEILKNVFFELMARVATHKTTVQTAKNARDTANYKETHDQWVMDKWQTLCSYYAEPQRHYHTLQHVWALWRHYDGLNAIKAWQQPDAVLLAIFYHDIIYDTKAQESGSHSDQLAKSNEQRSADYVARELGEWIAPSLCQWVMALIMMTQTHELPPWQEKNAKTQAGNAQDAALFLDMDLSILGSESSVYHQYADAIRREYAHVCDADYRKGRHAVLKKFLQRPRLYFSDYFYERFETQARTNVANERDWLTGIAD